MKVDDFSERRRLTSMEEEINYTLKRSTKRKTIGLKVDHHGLTVHAPWRASDKWLVDVLHQNEKWIKKKLSELIRDRAAPIEWGGDVKLLYLGQTLQLKILPLSSIYVNPPYLYVPQIEPQFAEALRVKVIQWYKQAALKHFRERAESFAGILGVKPPPVSLSNAQHLWGSCTIKGQVRINWRLIQAPETEIDYVIAHELAHLIELNHSEKFWKIVEGIYPAYSLARKQLREAQSQYYVLDA